ncbi:Serine/threonine protein kinase [Handroanthus impetiginosus]|uniref:Receptor-like serine/threonine-protein kinase n=1 Tax=Handroanthus impetiginosus TaxID=429701 RepID=A0A2G9H762_9LAMI|nr:Serine/threonine protein kinase [Handroanthus impetiginosus]
MAHSKFPTILYTIFHALTFLNICLGADTLFPNQTLENGRTLISANQIFEVGFFTPVFSGNTFLGIWYKSTPDVVVWVANRKNPINDSQEIALGIAPNGTLIITRNGTVIWYKVSSKIASNPVLRLLDTGNLVVVDDAIDIWQSFDSPSDTRLPGMQMVNNPNTGDFKYLTSWRNSIDPSPGDFTYRIENKGLPELVIFRGAVKRFRTGPWNGLEFSGSSVSPNPGYKLEAVFDKDLMLSVYEAYYSSTITRLTLQQSGLLQRYSMNEMKDKWNVAYTLPRDSCDNYGQCGPYGVCSIDKEPICECLKGFEPKAQQDWDWSSGCSRIRPLNCGSGDAFLEVIGVKYPDMVEYWLNTSMSLKECHDECLRNCSCVAYANTYITNGGTGCLMWFGELIDIREVHGADSKQIVYVRLPVSELQSNNNLDKTKKKKHDKAGKLIVISTITGVLISCLICLGIRALRLRLKKRAGKQKNEDFELPSFKMAAIAAATNNFSSENLIGEGGFGPVYGGKLSAEEEIAVKRLSSSSRQGLEEFKNEVILIAKLQHRNLVRLLGCCIEGDERLLIYEYMQNRSLDYFVFDENRKKLLTWPKRFDIIMGISKGLLYLHHDSRLKVIHRDLKTGNILLDGNLNPKISDFGLARIFGGDQTTARTKRVIGTYGYMAPEYAFDGKFSVKSDIFSIGVILLEIVSGKKNRGFSHCNHHHSLLGHAWLLWKENKALELMDECLKDTYNETQVKRCIHVALLCIQKFPENRPVMSSVVFMLGHEEAVLCEPGEPGFFMERSYSCNAENHASISNGSKKDSMTITDLEPR